MHHVALPYQEDGETLKDQDDIANLLLDICAEGHMLRTNIQVGKFFYYILITKHPFHTRVLCVNQDSCDFVNCRAH